MTNDYHLIPAYGKRYATEAEVIEAWNNGADFKCLNETASYLSKSTYENYCNRLDGVFYCFEGLYVSLVTAII